MPQPASQHVAQTSQQPSFDLHAKPTQPTQEYPLETQQLMHVQPRIGVTTFLPGFSPLSVLSPFLATHCCIPGMLVPVLRRATDYADLVVRESPEPTRALAAALVPLGCRIHS
jgi:hypothetical protein